MQASQIEKDIAAVGRIASVPSILRVLCQMTGMGFAAVARVTDGNWTACVVQDDIGFGLSAGGKLDVHTTLCKEVRAARQPIAIDHASLDPVYCDHHTPRTYSIESYVSVPIVLRDGEYFGNLCAIDHRPAKVSDDKTIATFVQFAQLVALELDNQRQTETVMKELFDERAGGALREQFIAVLGHDLRTPLAAVSACAQVLKRRHDDPQRVLELADRIGANVQRMSRLIEDVLDVARGKLGGGLQIRALPVDGLAALVQEVVDELREANPGRQVKLNVSIDREVQGDAVRIQQLVSNLVANALTHGAKDRPVDVTASTEPGRFVLSVHNTGDPIPSAAMGQIFDAFKRVDPSHRGGGLGLGLHICDQIVKAHGGQLVVTSTRDLGTRFTATLPAAQ